MNARKRQEVQSAGGASRAGRVLSRHDAMHPDHEATLIRDLQHMLHSRLSARMRARGVELGFPHAKVLHLVHDEPGLSGAQLARRCAVTAQTMNGFLVPLEKQGMIERVPDPENARVLKCYIRDNGKAMMRLGVREVRVVFSQMLKPLSNEERIEFRRLLRRCIDALRTLGEAESDEAGTRRFARKGRAAKATGKGLRD